MGTAAAAGTALALLASGTASGEVGYWVSSSVGGNDPRTYVQTYATNGEITQRMRLRILRGGHVIEDKVGTFVAFPTPGQSMADVRSSVELLTDDRVEWYYPEWAIVPAKVVIWDARPTLESCAIGSYAAAGRAHPSTRYLSVGAQRPPESPYGYSTSESGRVTTSGEFWTALFPRPLVPSDVVSMHAVHEPEPNLSVARSEYAAAGTCAPKPKGRGFIAFSGLDGALRRLARRDVRQRAATIRVRVTCLAESRIPCLGGTRVETVKRYAVASAVRKRVRLASAKLDLAPGKSKVVKLKIRRPGKRLLDRRRRLAATVALTSRDPAGDPLGSARTVTLKAVKPKRKRR